MSQHTALRRTGAIRIGLPAAVLGTLASAFAAAPAGAATAPVHGAVLTTSGPVAALLPPVSAAASVPTARTAPTATKATTYTVVSGDTVWAIARKFGLRTADIISWNRLGASAVIHPGQVLRLTAPGSAPAPAPATTPKEASTLPDRAATHTVARGDTVYGIAKKYGSTVKAIIAANRLGAGAIIYPGQKLVIPGSTGSPAPAATPVTPTPDPPAKTPSGTISHVVVKGDTVIGIAKKYGTTVKAIIAANRLGSNAIIYIGQTLVIPPKPAEPAQKSATLNAPQSENAALIIRIGREIGISDRGIAIALATAMVESGMRNLDYGDRDSLGLFQQRPSQGWGTPEQIRDRGRSIRVFFGGPNDPNGSTTRGLLDIRGWEQMGFSEAAQAVQISAFPDRYGQWEDAAYGWLARHG